MKLSRYEIYHDYSLSSWTNIWGWGTLLCQFSHLNFLLGIQFAKWLCHCVTDGARHLSNIPQARVCNLSCDIYQTYFRPGGFPQGAARLPVPGPGLHRHLQWLPQEGGIPLPRVAVHHSSSGERANICISFSFDKVSQRETKQWLGRLCWSSLS